MKSDKNIQTFFALVRAGLWADAEFTKSRKYGSLGFVDWDEVYQLAAEQSVIGLALAGIDWYKVNNSWFTIPQEVLLQWIGEVQIIEQQNKSLNKFVALLIEKLRKAEVYAILVKGQGIAQCYDKPLWRASGDVDLLLSEDNYQRAKKVLIPLADDVEQEYKSFKHIGMTLNGEYVVELHGTLHSRLSNRIDKGVDESQNDVFFGGNVRSWMNGSSSVFLPSPDNDVIFVFTHILHHFFIEGIGLRQICDWCRLMWNYKDSLNRGLLEKRIRNMGLVSEWRAFAALAVDWLGMPENSLPLYSNDKKWSKKANMIIAFIIETGNFGHNRKYDKAGTYIGRKFNSMLRKTKDFRRHISLFPIDSIRFFIHFMGEGIANAARRE